MSISPEFPHLQLVYLATQSIVLTTRWHPLIYHKCWPTYCIQKQFALQFSSEPDHADEARKLKMLYVLYGIKQFYYTRLSKWVKKVEVRMVGPWGFWQSKLALSCRGCTHGPHNSEKSKFLFQVKKRGYFPGYICHIFWTPHFMDVHRSTLYQNCSNY